MKNWKSGQYYNPAKILPLTGMLRVFVMLMFLPGASVIKGQILKDTASLNLIRRNVDYIYNFQFDEAQEAIRKVSRAYPDHPVVFLLRGMARYWENYPLIPSSSERSSYENDLRRSIEICDKKNYTDSEAEYLLANLCSRGLLLLFYADNDLSREVFPLATSTYRYIRQSFDFNSAYPDFCFFTGLYNYYREAYPDAHPIYKVLAVMFPKGDREKGLLELRKAAENSILINAESYTFLSVIYLGFEENYLQANYYNRILHEMYPDNPAYLGEYIKTLLLLKNYDEAEKLIGLYSEDNGNEYFQAQISIFNGIIQEKKYHNNEQAEEFYDRGIEEISAYGAYGNDFAAYAYFGLSRINDEGNDNRARRSFRKKAMDLATFKKISFDD